ncbi:uncharacterized protein LOC122367971 [Amphibalanus amphitrite]|uniref:uncharacterized protein LOC122367971 n=1 Tax=Amphibalanus amphitrite TaxID=1232801 RepID=UPI001C9190EE|nr:uncharacterized protein LOC122367971 [Amphibalanus amphitrite]
MARPRLSSLDDLVVNVATITIGDEATDEDLFTDDAEHEDAIVIVDQLEGVGTETESSPSGQPHRTDAKAALVRKNSSQRRIQQIRIRGKVVWEARLTEPAHCSDPSQALGLGLFIATDTAGQHTVYKADSLVSSSQLQLRARDRLLEVNGVPVSGWGHAALASFFLSIPLAPTRTPGCRGTSRANFWQPFSMLVERTRRPGSRTAEQAVHFTRILRARLSYTASKRQVHFSEVTARAAAEVGLTHTDTLRGRVRHVTSDSWLAVTSLLAGRSRLCTRQNEGDGTVFRVHRYRTHDPYSVPTWILETPDGQFVSSCGGTASCVSKGTGLSTGDQVTVADARCLFSRPAGADGRVTLETLTAGHIGQYLCVENRAVLVRPAEPGPEAVFQLHQVHQPDV